MKKFYSPLRYPGGKSRLAKLISQICLDNKIKGRYVEPFCGGASVALYLLFEDKFKKIIINDLDKSIYAFWYSVLNNNDKLCKMVEETKIDIENWKKQKSIQKNKNKYESNKFLVKLGFSTLFLNRTNFSGIIRGGPLGGLDQRGKYKLDCKFKKEMIIKRIKEIAKRKDRIELYNLDCLELIKKIQKKYSKKTIFYFDPPYYLKSPDLYMNYYTYEDHKKLASAIKNMKNMHWIVSYDNNEKIKFLYRWVKKKKEFSLKHFVNRIKNGKEVLFFENNLVLKGT